MKNKYILNTLRFFGLLTLQVLILNHIRIAGFINPYVYILYVMLLPFSISGWQLLFAGFAMGISVDLFMGTPGLHAAATVFIAFMRPTVIKLATGSEPENVTEPNLTEMGGRWFFAYSISLVFLHHVVVFLLESFSFANILNTLMRTVFSIVVSEIFILLIMYIFKPSKKL